MLNCGGGGGGNSAAGAFCWGSGSAGIVGNGTTNNSSVPDPVIHPSGVTSWKQISTAGAHACAIGSDDQAYCWGQAQAGRLGNGNASTSQSSPSLVTKPSGVTSWKQISASTTSTCAIGSNDRAYCWGQASSGALGNGTNTPDVSTPSLVTNPSGVTTWKSVAGGGSNVNCGIAGNDQVYCWGSAIAGQLGNGDTSTNQLTPVPVSGAVTTWRKISEGGSGPYRCAIATTNQIYCWGQGVNGELGNSASSDSSVPVQVTRPSGVTSWTDMANGNNFACAIADTGDIYCWGFRSSGNFGDGTSISTTGAVNAPNLPVTKPSGVTTWSKIAVASGTACAVGNNNKNYCWGGAGSGRLGNGTTTPNQPTPVEVTTSSQFSAIGGRSSTFCSIGTALPVPVIASSSQAAVFGYGPLDINKPSGTASGDLLVAVVQVSGSVFTSTPSISGFTLIDGTTGQGQYQDPLNHSGDITYYYVAYKIAGSSEPATYSFNAIYDGDNGYIYNITGVMYRITGASKTAPIVTSASSVVRTGTTGTYPSVTTTTPNNLILSVGMFWSLSTQYFDVQSTQFPYAAPSGTTDVGLNIRDDYALQDAAYATQINPGATGAKTSSLVNLGDGDGDEFFGITVAIKP